MNTNSHDIDILARTVWGEARGEGLGGMIAVAWAVLNRATIAAQQVRKQFGDGSIAAACLVPLQFSCWNASDPNLPYLKLQTLDAPPFQLAYLAALSAITGNVPDPTQGATHYFNPDKVEPEWAEGKPYVSIGHHRFLKDV